MMQRLLAFALLILTLPAFAQNGDHYRTIVRTGQSCQYIIPDQEIDDAWRGPGFDDQAWSEGINGIGYGDDDDSTVVSSGIHSVYIRFRFTVEDTALLRQLILDMDYDDGFAAYLNGTEIASGNITKPYSWNMTLERDHEAGLYRGIVPERWIIGKSTFSSMVGEGENILAVEVHNVGTSSSDFSSNVFLHGSFTEPVAAYTDPPAWFNPPITLHSHLPIVKLNTGGASIPDEPKIPGEMEIIYTEGDTSSQYDAPNVYSGKIGIEQRGESSAGFPKKQYTVETQTDSGTKRNVSLLGLPSENDWVLYAPYSDKSLMKNVLTHTLSRQMGNSAPRTRYVEVILNGQYQGVYVLIEKIKQDEGRVDIAKLLPTDTAGNELTGGYVLRNDKTNDMAPEEYWESPVSEPYGLKNLYMYYDPKYDKLHPTQREYIKDHMRTFDLRLVSWDFKDSLNGYRKYTDVLSFIDYMFIHEMSMDVDCYHFSTYFYKDKDSDGGKIHAGPTWDYNLAWGNVNYGNVEADDGFMYTRGGRMYWWKRMMEDPWYANVAYTRWDELRADVLSWQNIEHIIDSCVTLMGPAIDRNFERWPTLGTYIWANIEWPDTYEGEVEMLKSFIQERLPWLDSQWSGRGNAVDYPPHLECMEDQYLTSAIPNAYIPSGDELDPSFVWDDFNIGKLENNINGEQTLENAYITDGSTVQWTVTDSKGQQKSCSFKVYVTGVNVNEKGVPAGDIRVYPNPASERVSVEAPFPVKSIAIASIDGRIIKRVFPGMDSRSYEIDTGSYEEGVYTVTVTAESGYRQSQILILRH